MHIPNPIKYTISVLLLSVAIFSINSPAHAATERASFFYFILETLDTAIFWLQLVPQLLNLALVITSLYLMLDGVRRWGTNTSGAFSRTLIGLFILHTSSAGLPFLPYLALYLQIWLCARGVEARVAARAGTRATTIAGDGGAITDAGSLASAATRDATSQKTETV